MTTAKSAAQAATLPVIANARNPGAGIDYRLFLDCTHCGLCTSSCPTYAENGDENDREAGSSIGIGSTGRGPANLSAR